MWHIYNSIYAIHIHWNFQEIIMDTWNPNKDNKGWLKQKGAPRQVVCYKLICTTTNKRVGEAKDLISAINKAKNIEKKYRTKILITPVKE